LKVNVYNSQKQLTVSKESVRALVKAVLSNERSSHQETSIYFVTEKAICDMHEKFFNDPTTTDCISFPLDAKHLGEVFVCPQTAITYAEKNDLNPHDELSLYVIHGLLHCLGYDDLTAPERRIMRKKEKSCMDLIRSKELTLTP
jgi:probable rRNA maturation factor